MRIQRILLSAVAVLSAAGMLLSQNGPTALDRLRQGFNNPSADARIMMRWWWFGAAVTKPELEREMQVMKDGGIGGFEVQPVYPLANDDPAKGLHNLPYLSDEYLDMLRFSSEKAKELGLRMDITLGSGWPFGGPHTDVTQAAGALRVDRVEIPAGAVDLPFPSIAEGEKFLGGWVAKGTRRQFDGSTLRRLDVTAGKRVKLPAGLNGYVALFFIAGRTGQQVKRPAVQAEGFVLDHYDQKAIQKHLEVVGNRLMRAFGPNPPYAVFSDSLEVFASDWTPDLLAEFQKRRGYDLTPYLPALVGDIGEKTAAVRADWGKTQSELCDENYLIPISQWAKAHGTRFRSQTYGVPPVTMSSNNLVDLPEGEKPHWRTFTATKWASSASHIYGRQVTSSETWTWLHSPAFRATPLDMKVEADLHFLIGINQLVGHGWPYSPESAGEPGWRFYAAAVFNEHNPWWIVMPDVTKYLQRMSWLLRQGKPANDIAVYLPISDAFASFTAGKNSVDRTMETMLGEKLIPQILNAGFGYDFTDDGAIQKLGITHPVLVVPNVERMPLATIRKLEEYVAKGGKVVAVKRAPSIAPGLSEAKDSAEVARISKGLFPAARMISEEDKIGATLAGLLAPDFAAASNQEAIGFIHRKLESADVYFVANTSNQAVHTKVTLRTKGVPGEWWDPFTMQVHGADAVGGTVALDLEPYESRVLVLSADSKAKPAAVVTAQPQRFDLTKNWQVFFNKMDYQPQITDLKSWTADPQTKYFSGRASYEKNVELPAALFGQGKKILLDFGPGTPLPVQKMANGMRAWLDPPMREAVYVEINGTNVGAVWHPPFQIDVTRVLKPGRNNFNLIVANTAINGLAGSSLPDYKLLTLRYGSRFQPQDMDNLQPLPSGLLGTVTLVSK